MDFAVHNVKLFLFTIAPGAYMERKRFSECMTRIKIAFNIFTARSQST